MNSLRMAVVGGLGLIGAALAPGVASASYGYAANGYSTADVNQRSGPGVEFPPIAVIPAGSPVTIHGCLAEAPWCDVAWYGYRGWVSARYLEGVYGTSRVAVPAYRQTLGIPFIAFSVGVYWGQHYRDDSFFDQWPRWTNWHPEYYGGPWWQDDVSGAYVKPRHPAESRPYIAAGGGSFRAGASYAAQAGGPESRVAGNPARRIAVAPVAKRIATAPVGKRFVAAPPIGKPAFVAPAADKKLAEFKKKRAAGAKVVAPAAAKKVALKKTPVAVKKVALKKKPVAGPKLARGAGANARKLAVGPQVEKCELPRRSEACVPIPR